MALTTKAKQKKLAKKAAKRKSLQKEKNANASLSPREKKERKVAKALNFPIHQCLIPTNLFEVGMGQLVFSRRIAPNRVGVGFFLIDIWAYGVKDCDYFEFTYVNYEEQIKEMIGKLGEFNEVSPEHFKKLVLESEKFAKSHDVLPHPDYSYTKKIFSDINESACLETFEMGKDGEFFVVEHVHHHEHHDHHHEHQHGCGDVTCSAEH